MIPFYRNNSKSTKRYAWGSVKRLIYQASLYPKAA